MAGPLEDMTRETLQKAEQGDAWYQHLACALYEQGQLVPQDYPQAVAWCRKAAEQGLAEAQISPSSRIGLWISRK
jgi:TPR repeat protein